MNRETMHMSAHSIAFSFDHQGKTFQCFYSLKEDRPGTIHVSTPWGPREAEMAGESPLAVARLVAGELARDATLR